MAVDGQESFAVCNAERFAVSKVSQADAPQRCLSAYRASYTLGSPEINGNLFFIRNMYIHIRIIYACAMNCTQSPTLLITHGQPS